MADSIQPSQTLYINNINEKVKIDVLKKMFYMVFSQYGKVVDISARKGDKLRGQAWVTFQDVPAATNALRGKQGFNFYGKALVRKFYLAEEVENLSNFNLRYYYPSEFRTRNREVRVKVRQLMKQELRKESERMMLTTMMRKTEEILLLAHHKNLISLPIYDFGYLSTRHGADSRFVHLNLR
jgi:RNA recognition motif-containing protein